MATKDPAKRKATVARYYQRTKDSHRQLRLERTKDWVSRNPSYHSEYRKTNAGIINAKTARHRASKKLATPKWLSAEQKAQILAFYREAKELEWLNNGMPLEVDHVVPLQNDIVCGLHVPWNLQILPLPSNRTKGNKLC